MKVQPDGMPMAKLNDASRKASTAKVTPVAIQVIANHLVVWKTAE